MNFSNRKEEGIRIDINLTPLIDVTLQLVIFFMITTSFMTNAGIDVKLPKASTKDVQQQQELVVSITKAKKIFLNEDLINLSSLPDHLLQMQKKAARSVLVIRADEEVPHGLVVEVMDIAKKTGIENLAIATEFNGEDKE